MGQNIRVKEFPPEYEERRYRTAYQDLGSMDGGELRSHFERFGREEGRIASLIGDRESLAAFTMERANGGVLELGPFCNPILRGASVKYFDVLNEDQLRQRAKAIGLTAADCPVIDYVSPIGDLDIINEQFDIVFSSHTVEHQPDLIKHFQDIQKILLPGGVYVLIIPDRRYCFDFFLRESCFSEVIAAHVEGRTLHSSSSFFAHRLMLTHNDPVRHWNGDHGALSDVMKKTKAASHEWQVLKGSYIDVHAWQFTPASFAELLNMLNEAGFVGLRIERLYHTRFNSLEFYVVLRKDS